MIVFVDGAYHPNGYGGYAAVWDGGFRGEFSRTVRSSGDCEDAAIALGLSVGGTVVVSDHEASIKTFRALGHFVVRPTESWLPLFRKAHVLARMAMRLARPTPVDYGQLKRLA